jgi:hypothetical protein
VVEGMDDEEFLRDLAKNKCAPNGISVAYASEEWQTGLVVNMKDTTPKMKQLARCIVEHFDKFPEPESVLKLIWASDEVDMGPIIQAIKNPKYAECDCVVKAQKHFDPPPDSYSSYYQAVESLNQREDIACRHYCNNDVFKLKYNISYKDSINEIISSIDQFMDDNQNVMFIVVEYWNEITKRLQQHVRFNDAAIRTSNIQKLKLLGYIVMGNDLSSLVTDDRQTNEFIKRVLG